MSTPSSTREGNRRRVAKHRATKAAEQLAQLTAMQQAEIAAGLRSALSMLEQSGLAVPSLEGCDPGERALIIQRLLSAADKGLSLAVRQGQLINKSEHRRILTRLALGVRQALDSLPGRLPAHLGPDERGACEAALREAVVAAMAAIPDEPCLVSLS